MRQQQLLACMLLFGLAATPHAQDGEWPQWRGPTRDGVWQEGGLLEALPEGQLPLRWSVPVGPGYSGPTVAEGRVYLTERKAEDEDEDGERLRCFAFDNGAELWSHDWDTSYEGIGYQDGPRCSVLVADGRATALGASGVLVVVDAESGELVWERDLREQYEIEMPIWGISAAPILEAGALIVPVSGAQACLVAFDPESGEQLWQALDDRGNYSAPIMVEQAGERVLVLWTGDRVVGVRPATGEELWAVEWPAKNMPLGVASPVLAGDTLFLTGFYDGSLAMRLEQDELGVEVLWRLRGQSERSTAALHSIIGTPLVLDEHVYGVDSYGELRCLELATGERIWEDQTAVPRARWATIHMVQNGETSWMFNDRGELIMARLTPEGFDERSRAQLIEPTLGQLNRRDGVCWSHPAFAYQHVLARNDERLVCASLRIGE